VQRLAAIIAPRTGAAPRAAAVLAPVRRDRREREVVSVTVHLWQDLRI
jgi:hypothetical protein